MRSFRLAGPLFLCLLATMASAQTISGTYPGSFVDISTTGGTAIPAVGDDTVHAITTTIGNAMFPAGPVSITNNGHATAIAGGTYVYTESDIPLPTGTPVNFPAASVGNGVLLAWWDDLYPNPNPSSGTIWWQELSGVLYIMWLNENHFADTVAGDSITFEIQVFSNPGAGPWIQYLYNDTVFGGAYSAYDNAASATIGYINGASNPGNNLKWSFDTAGAVSAGTVISMFPSMQLTASSPFGAGSIQLAVAAGPAFGTYFMGVTLYGGAYPNGWLYGLDIPFPELGSEISAGFPFLGTLDPTGAFTVGPFGGAPSGLTLYAVALGIPLTSTIPTIHSPAITYTIP